MGRNLTVASWVVIKEGCPISYRLNGRDEIEFRFGSEWDGFEFVFDAGILFEFVNVSNRALEEVSARA